MYINNSDIYKVNFNQRGVFYMEEINSKRVIAKRCTKCSTWKFLNDFNKAGKGFSGTHSLCRSCHKQNGADYREALKVDAHVIALHEKSMIEYFTKIHQEEMARLHANQVKKSLMNNG